MGFDAGSITGRIDLDASASTRNLQGFVGAAQAGSAQVDAAFASITQALSGSVSPALERMARTAGASLASLAPTVERATAGASAAVARAQAEVAAAANRAAAAVAPAYERAGAAVASVGAAAASVSSGLAQLTATSRAEAERVGAAFAAAAEPLRAALAPAIERVAAVATPAFERVRSSVAAVGTAASAARGPLAQLAAEAAADARRAGDEWATAAGRIGRDMGSALDSVITKVGSLGEEILKVSSVAGLAALTTAVGAVYESVERAGDRFHEMGLAAERAGVSVEWLSRLSAVASTVGLDLEGLSNGMRLLEQQAAQAAEGDESAIKAFARLGISAQQAALLMQDPQKMLERVRDGIAELGNASDRVLAARGLLGRQGSQLTPLLTMDTGQFDQVADRMQRLGGTVSEADAEMGRSLGELEGYFHAAMLGIEREVSKPILSYLQQHMDQIEPQIERAVKSMGDAVGEAWDWIATEADQLLPRLDAVGGAAGGGRPDVRPAQSGHAADRLGGR